MLQGIGHQKGYEQFDNILMGLLRRILDDNKRVQEAACSAFATLEEVLAAFFVYYSLNKGYYCFFFVALYMNLIMRFACAGGCRRFGTTLGNYIKAPNDCIWEISGDFMFIFIIK